jgi:hypothetical protein
MMLQLDPPLWLETPRGPGLAHVLTWPNIEHSLLWTVFLENGQVWTFPNEQVRAGRNFTADRPAPEKPKPA